MLYRARFAILVVRLVSVVQRSYDSRFIIMCARGICPNAHAYITVSCSPTRIVYFFISYAHNSNVIIPKFAPRNNELCSPATVLQFVFLTGLHDPQA